MTKSERQYLMDKFMRLIKEMHGRNPDREALWTKADAIIRKIRGA